jgi:hypothetical protein
MVEIGLPVVVRIDLMELRMSSQRTNVALLLEKVERQFEKSTDNQVRIAN